jgi:hypothetical protein
MPCYDLRCHCGFLLQDVMFPSSRINWRSGVMNLKCNKCNSVGKWTKMPSVPNLKKSGAYSFNNGCKKDYEKS